MFRAGEDKLGWAGLRSEQNVRRKPASKAPGQRLGDEVRLVVPALTLAVGMQRDGDNGVERGCCDGAEGLREPGGEPVAEARYLLVFEEENGGGQRAAVTREAAGEIKGIEIRAAKAAARLRGMACQ